MTIISSSRPRTWNSIVGQETAVRLLKAVLTNRFLPRGFIFRGVYGVGKTTAAYIYARALMCTGTDPLGCGKCPSCASIDGSPDIEEGLHSHPDFLEVKAAETRGVENARTIVSQSDALPVIGRRRVILFDEAHQLSHPAWDAFLDTLEKNNTDSIFIFTTNEGDKIPGTIRSRCCIIPFGKIATETLVGLLSSVASRNNIAFELSALKDIARAAKGHARTALEILGVAGSMGRVNRDTTSAAIDLSLEEFCKKIFQHAALRNQLGAVELADEACRSNSPVLVIEELFCTLGRIAYGEESPLRSALLPRLPALTTLFIKWSASLNIPADAMPLMILEMINTISPGTEQNLAPLAVGISDSKKELATSTATLTINEFCRKFRAGLHEE